MQFLTAALVVIALFAAWFFYDRVRNQRATDTPPEPPRCDGCTGDNSCGIPGFACAVEQQQRQHEPHTQDNTDA